MKKIKEAIIKSDSRMKGILVVMIAYTGIVVTTLNAGATNQIDNYVETIDIKVQDGDEAQKDYLVRQAAVSNVLEDLNVSLNPQDILNFDLNYKILKGEIMEENFEGEELDNIIILNDEDGNEVRFEFLDLVELEDEQYVVLLPVLEEGEEDDGEVVILKVEDSEEDSEQESYVSVENEETLMKVFNIFKEKFKDEFDFVDGEE